MGRKSQLLLVDADSLLRDGLCALLNLEADFEVVGAVADGPTLATIHLPTDPDVVIVDFSAPEIRGPELVVSARTRWPQVLILVLTFRRDDEVIETALRAGVDGYLLKSDNRTELVTAIRTILQGKRYMSPSLFDRVGNGGVAEHTNAPLHDTDGLSDREREVMKRIAQGYRTREIAEQLSLSHKTVEKHRSTLMRKLGLRSATAVAAYAISHGYLVL